MEFTLSLGVYQMKQALSWTHIWIVLQSKWSRIIQMKPQIRYIRMGYKTILERTVFLFIILNSNFKTFAIKKQFQVPASWREGRTILFAFIQLYLFTKTWRIYKNEQDKRSFVS